MFLENALVSSQLMRALRVLSPDTPFGQLKYLTIPLAVDAIGIITAVSMACQSIQVEPFPQHHLYAAESNRDSSSLWSVQALHVVQCQRLPYLPPFPYLRHLVLCTDSLIEIFGSLEGFPYLETLSVTLFHKVEAPPRPDVELEHLPNLVHLHMTGFVPAVLNVGEACRVHAEWDDNHTSQIQWLLDWSSLGVELASFSFWSPDHLHEDALEHILDILQ